MTGARWRSGARDAALLTPALAVLALLFGGAIVGVTRVSLVPLEQSASLDAWRALFVTRCSETRLADSSETRRPMAAGRDRRGDDGNAMSKPRRMLMPRSKRACWGRG